MSKKTLKVGYVDNIVLPMKKTKLKEYLRMAKISAKVWKDHGALQYLECLADDVPKGKITSYPLSVKQKAGEAVVVTWIVYRSRAHRDQVMAKVMSDPRVAEMMNDPKLPFDGMRMFWGGFKPIVSA